MSDIPVSSVVQVIIGVAPTFPSRKGFGTLNIIGPSSVIGTLERSRIYNSIDGVAADFAPDSEEYKAALVYYSQSPAPQQLVISRRVATPIGAVLRGGANNESVVNNWKAITTGSVKISVGSGTTDITGLNFGTVNSLAGVAAVIQAAVRAAGAAPALTAAVVEYRDRRFQLTAGDTGPSSVVGFAAPAATGADISAKLAWTAATAARLAPGSDTETPVQALSASQDANQDWYGVAFTKEVRDTEAMMDVAAWVQARTKMFGFDTEDRENLDSLNDSSLAYRLDQGAYSRTLGAFNDVPGEYSAVSALARLFTTNYNVADSTITLKFKQEPTITPADLRASEKQAIDKIHLNAYYDVGGNPMLGEGWMFGGRFADEVHGLDWLQNAIETNVFGKLYTDGTKTPMTDAGAATLQQQVEKGLDQAINNGLGAPGYLPDGTYLQKGYITDVVKIKDHNQSDKEARQGPPITFKLIGAGAIHGITVNGTFQR
jgi:hypothetical protein